MKSPQKRSFSNWLERFCKLLLLLSVVMTKDNTWSLFKSQQNFTILLVVLLDKWEQIIESQVKVLKTNHWNVLDMYLYMIKKFVQMMYQSKIFCVHHISWFCFSEIVSLWHSLVMFNKNQNLSDQSLIINWSTI